MSSLADRRAVATVGTANMDYRSLFVNYELNRFSANRALCLVLGAQFLADLAQSEEITVARWSQRHWSRRRGIAFTMEPQGP